MGEAKWAGGDSDKVYEKTDIFVKNLNLNFYAQDLINL